MGNKRYIKYSIIIPIYDPDNKKTDVINRCLRSIERHSKQYEYEVIQIWNTKGFPIAVNNGIRNANGDYIVILNDDIEILEDDWLKKLTDSYSIVSYKLNRFFLTNQPFPDGSLWCMHKEIYNKIGLLDERFAVGYGFEDSDYWMRAVERNIGFKSSNINLKHEGSVTFNTYFKDNKEEMTSRCQSLFYEKWKDKIEKI